MSRAARSDFVYGPDRAILIPFCLNEVLLIKDHKHHYKDIGSSRLSPPLLY